MNGSSRERSKDAAKASHHDVALFLGESTVVDPLVQAFVDERLQASSRALDFEIFRVGERSIGEVEAALRQVGMFSPGRVIWLRGFSETRRRGAAVSDADGDDDDVEVEESAEEDPSAELLALVEGGIPSDSLLILSAATLDARSRLFKWLAKNADVVDRRVQIESRGGKLTEEGLRRAVERRLEELGVTRIGKGAVDEIVRRSGTGLGETLQEIDRLVLSQPDPSALEAGDVRSSMRDLALGWVFDLTRAIERRDLAAAENLIARLLSAGEAPLRLTATLASHFARLAEARPVVDTLPRGWLAMRGPEFLAGPGANLPEPLRGWRGYFSLHAAVEFPLAELRRLHGEVRRLDAAIKSTPIPPLLLFSRLLQDACIRRGGAATRRAG